MVLIGATSVLFDLAGVDASGFVENYLVVFGGLAISIVAVYLVERKKTVIEKIAPVLARIFTPLFLLLIISVLVAVAVSGGVRENREILISLDLLLVVVLGRVLYTMSARDEEDPMRLSDWLTFGLLLAALVLDAVSLSAMSITHARTKTELIKLALTNTIDQDKKNRLLHYHGKLDLGIDLGALRKR